MQTEEQCLFCCHRPDLLTDLNAVDSIELDVVLSDISLYLTWEVLIQLFMLPLAVAEGMFRLA